MRDEPAALGLVPRLVDLLGPPGVRLLAEHMLAGGERPQRPFVVERVRQGDVDRVELGVCEQVVVAAMGPGDPMFPRVGDRSWRIPRPDRVDRERRVAAARTEDRSADARSREKSESDRRHAKRILVV